MNKQKGIALFQVLLIITILMLLAIFVTHKAKGQLDSAQKIADKQQAMLAVTSTLSQVSYGLLSYPVNELIDKHAWNFYGKEFLIGDVKVSIQDNNGLLSLHKNTPNKIVSKLISLAASADEDKQLMSPTTFINWFTQPNNIRIQNMEQFISMGFSFRQATELWSCITTLPLAMFNPMNVPDKLLVILFDETQVQQLRELRINSNTYNEIKQQTQTITNIYSDEAIGYITGPNYRVKISAIKNKSQWNMLYELGIVQRINGYQLITLSQKPF